MDPSTPVPPPPPVAPVAPVGEDKTVAIVAYLTLIGFIVAVVLHQNNKTRLGAYHLRQTLGLLISFVALAFGASLLMFIPFIGWLIAFTIWLAGLALFVFAIMGFIAAINGQMKPIPVLGEHYQKWFAGTFD